VGVSSLVRIEEVVIRLPDRAPRPSPPAPGPEPDIVVQPAAETPATAAEPAAGGERARKLEDGISRIRARFGENAIRRGAAKVVGGVAAASSGGADDGS
jgi:hypothetical protein